MELFHCSTGITPIARPAWGAADHRRGLGLSPHPRLLDDSAWRSRALCRSASSAPSAQTAHWMQIDREHENAKRNHPEDEDGEKAQDPSDDQQHPKQDAQ